MRYSICLILFLPKRKNEFFFKISIYNIILQQNFIGMLESDFWNLVVRYVSYKNLSKLEMIKIPERVIVKQIDSIGKDIYWLNFQLPNVTYLNLSFLNLKNIPCLPSGLTWLYCSHNKLQTLPCLPSGLKHLDCYHNQLQTLPDLPSGLEVLYCSNNQLQTLPCLPGGLKNLDCYHNQLQTLPCLPSGLEYLWCYNNQLQTLPCLPNTLIRLKISHNMLDLTKHMEIPERCLIKYV